MGSQSLLITRKITAALLGISVSMVDKLARQGKLEPIRFGRRVMFRRDAVLRLTLTDSERRAMYADGGCPGTIQ